MIEFQLKIDSRILNAIIPKIEESFSLAGKRDWKKTFACPNLDDPDLANAWNDGLQEDFFSDRKALAKLLESQKFKYGYVEVKEEEVESIVRSLSEVRLTIRESFLFSIEDDKLESGDFDLAKQDNSVRLGYFSYLVLAEIQENLIANSN